MNAGNTVSVRVGERIHELAGDSAADLMERLRQVGQFDRDDDSGERIPVSTSATACKKFRDALHSRRPAELTDEELGAVRAVLEHWANETPGGFSAMPPDLVALRHAIADRPNPES